jgi:hypothetical protein
MGALYGLMLDAGYWMLDTQDFLNHDIHKIQNPGTSIQDRPIPTWAFVSTLFVLISRFMQLWDELTNQSAHHLPLGAQPISDPEGNRHGRGAEALTTSAMQAFFLCAKDPGVRRLLG